MAIDNQNKSDQIRALYLEGKTRAEIVRMGYARTTVHVALGKGRVRRPSERILEDILTIQEESLRLLRMIVSKQFPDIDPGA